MSSNWIFLLLLIFLVLGLRDRTAGGSTHLTLLVSVVGVLTLMFVSAGNG